MREVAHHVALALAILALAHAALLVATRLTPRGLERLLAAVVLGVATAVAQALALGLVGLGASPVALCAAAAATWAVTVRMLPGPGVSPWAELGAWWAARGPAERVGAGALGGAALAWLAWQLRYPSIGFDSALYHYGLVAGWIDNGRPGSVVALSYDIPYDSYPATDEVALTWGSGIARSWIPIALWNPAMLVLLMVATWHTLRSLSVGVRAAGLATATLAASPLVVRQLNEAQTDLPALAWLACAVALVCGAGRRPALLVPTLLAVGLAIGTKTTTAPLALPVLALGAYAARGRLRPLAGWLALGAAGAVVVGGVWYLRNLVNHGSPLWPFAPGPWGDPPPRFFASIDATFLQRPIATLDGRLDEYAERIGGGGVALAGALAMLAAALVARRWEPSVRRPLLAAGALTALAVVAWSMAWGTGLQDAGVIAGDIWSLSATRYLLPGIAAAIVTLALATRIRGTTGAVAAALLAITLVWSLVVDAGLGAPYTPSATTPVAGALLGITAVVVAGWAWRARAGGTLTLRLPAAAGVVAGAVALGALAAPVSNGYLERYTRVSASTAFGAEVTAWHLRRPGFANGDRPVAFASRAVLAQLAGDHFTHPLELVPARIGCDELDRLATRATVVVTDGTYWGGILGIEPYSAPACVARRRPAYRDDAYAVLVSDDRSAAPPVARLRSRGHPATGR